MTEPNLENSHDAIHAQENPPANEIMDPISRTPELPPPSESNQLSASDERTWALLAHLSVVLNLVTGLLGALTALVIYLVFRNRSRYVEFQSLQSLVFQLVCFGGSLVFAGLMWIIIGLLSIVLVGLLCIPFGLLISCLLAAVPIIAVIYGIVGAIKTGQGEDFRYWLIGDWVIGLLGKSND
jgi:uncharacterized Tic20 family protein